MATMTQTIAYIPGVSLFQRMLNTLAAKLEKHSVPHWCEYLNEK